jgi:hypothetical protein
MKTQIQEQLLLRTINKIKEDMNKHSNEFHETSNKELNEIKEIMWDMKEKFNDDIEIWGPN